MLVFVIPVKSREITKSWDLLSKLLDRCLKSIYNQTSPNFKVVVVCNQKPDVTFEHQNIHYLEVDFPAPKLVTTDQAKVTGYEFVHGLDIANKNADKARKILTGIDYSEQFHPDYVMVVDADDCVSCRLVEFVECNPGADGWVMRKGYMYKEGSRLVYINAKRFNHVSGTSLIIKYGVHPIVFEGSDFYQPSYNKFPENADIRTLPFPGALYSMMNGENILMSNETFTQMRGQILSSIPSLLQKLIRYRIGFLNQSIVREFGLYDVNLVESPKNNVLVTQS